MAKLKYSDGALPLRGELSGFTFQSNHYGFSLTSSKRNDRWRYPSQDLRKRNLIAGSSRWRELSGFEQTDWGAWSVAIPQPQKADPVKTLSGYHCFNRRQSYVYLKDGPLAPLMVAPNFTVYESDPFGASVAVTASNIIIDLTFSRGNSDLDCFLFLSDGSHSASSGVWSGMRFMACVGNSPLTIDLTAAYLNYFGKMPPVGAELFISMVQAGNDNGQIFFYTPALSPVAPPVPPIIPIRFGLLYNGFCVDGADPLSCSTDWLFISQNQFISWFLSFATFSNIGGVLKSTDSDYWNPPNSGAVDSILFNFSGAGFRTSTLGVFQSLRSFGYFWNSDATATDCRYVRLASNSAGVSVSNQNKRNACSIRFFRPVSGVPNGTLGTYTGNNGRIYQTAVFSGYEFMCDNLAETLFRSGSPIPEVTNNAAWAALSSPALCAYNNDWSNV